MRLLHTLLLFWIVGLAACAQEDAESLASPGTLWSVDTVPALVILDTLVEGEPGLLFPSGATMLSNGVIVVADRWADDVRFFDRSGDLVRTVGQPGEGPGEFTAPSWLGQCGADSVFVWDHMQNQMSVIDSAGSVVREYVPSGNPSWFRCARTGQFAVFGALVQTPGSVAEAVNTPSTAPLRFEDAAGDSIGGVGILPIGESTILGKITQYAITRREPTEQNIDQWLEAQVALFPESDYREQMKELMRRMSPVPTQLPLYTGLSVDPEGVIWVVLSSPGDGETRFQAVAEDGRLLADLRVPAEITVYEVGRDYILGAFYGANDVPGIVVYGLQRGSP